MSPLQDRRVEHFDVSPEISEDLAVFPGDTPFKRRVLLGFDRGDHLGLSSVETTVHIGAHADAPSHYRAAGASIEARSLDYYIGPAQVLSVQAKRGARISPSDVRTKILAARVLFKTGSFPDPRRWSDDFNSLSPELVAELAERGVRLVGIDTPSVDPAESKALETHQALFERDMAVLEGLQLAEAPDGLYTLVAAPLKIRGADAAPVRAVLLKP